MIYSLKSTKLSKCRSGQASLEYLLVTAAFLGVLLMLAPYFGDLLELAVFTSDVGKAQYFIDQIKHKASFLHWIGNGSKEIITANPELEWEFNISNNTIQVTITSASLNKKKILERETEAIFSDYSAIINENTEIVLEKENGKISVKYN